MTEGGHFVKRDKASICFLGLQNLPILSTDFGSIGAGGAELQQTMLAQKSAKNGYNVSMIVFDYGQKEGVVINGITTYKAYKPNSGLPILRFITHRWLGVWSALKRADADIIHVTCAGMLVGLVALYAKIYNKKFVYRVAHNDDCNPDSLLIKHWRDRKLFEFGLLNADLITVQNDTQQRELIKHYNVHSLLTRSLMETPGPNFSLEDRKIPILWVNNIRQFKRPDLFLEIAQSLKHLEFNMVGGAAEGFKELYAKVASAAKDIPNLIFHGRVSYHDINSYYEKTRLFVNTSDSEGFPNSYLQAWVRGTPVIAFFDPDDVIKKEQLGRAVETLDEMLIAIEEYSSNDRLWEETSQRCRNYMSKFYNEKDILSQYFSAFDRLVYSEDD